MSIEIKRDKTLFRQVTNSKKEKKRLVGDRKVFFVRAPPKPSKVQAIAKVLLTGNPRGPPMIITRFLNARDLKCWIYVCKATSDYVQALTQPDWMHYALRSLHSTIDAKEHEIDEVILPGTWRSFIRPRDSPVYDRAKTLVYLGAVIDAIVDLRPQIAILRRIALNPMTYATHDGPKKMIAMHVFITGTAFDTVLQKALEERKKSPTCRQIITIYDQDGKRHPESWDMSTYQEELPNTIVHYTWSRPRASQANFSIVCLEGMHAVSWSGGSTYLAKPVDEYTILRYLATGNDVYCISGVAEHSMVWRLNYERDEIVRISSVITKHVQITINLKM
jgi:hypothetical protein